METVFKYTSCGEFLIQSRKFPAEKQTTMNRNAGNIFNENISASDFIKLGQNKHCVGETMKKSIGRASNSC